MIKDLMVENQLTSRAAMPRRKRRQALREVKTTVCFLPMKLRVIYLLSFVLAAAKATRFGFTLLLVLVGVATQSLPTIIGALALAILGLERKN